jgi:phage shock protein E
MNKRVAVWVVSILIFIFSFAFNHLALGDEEKAQVIKDVSASEALSLVERRGNDPHFIILDIRTEEEFTQGHIENAINIDYRSEDFSRRLQELDKGDAYLLYCKSGGRSAKALEIMKELGFREVYHLFKGFMSWEEEGLPVSK